jgi:hypothetical protein
MIKKPKFSSSTPSVKPAVHLLDFLLFLSTTCSQTKKKNIYEWKCYLCFEALHLITPKLSTNMLQQCICLGSGLRCLITFWQCLHPKSTPQRTACVSVSLPRWSHSAYHRSLGTHAPTLSIHQSQAPPNHPMLLLQRIWLLVHIHSYSFTNLHNAHYLLSR